MPSSGGIVYADGRLRKTDLRDAPDSLSVDTTSGGRQRGRDNAKNVDGRKLYIVVDCMGLLVVLVTDANVDDAAAVQKLFGRLDGRPMNCALYEWVEDDAQWQLGIVRRAEGSEGCSTASPLMGQTVNLCYGFPELSYP